MAWELTEALEYYGRQGAARDQAMLAELLREIQREMGGISRDAVSRISESCGIPESLPLALIRRYPSLRLEDSHTLELCCGPNCGKAKQLRKFLEETAVPKGITVRFVSCMRMCGKGPNLRWDGTLYSKADKALLQKLLEKK